MINALGKLGEFPHTGVFSEMSNLLNNTENISIWIKHRPSFSHERRGPDAKVARTARQAQTLKLSNLDATVYFVSDI